MRPLLQPLMLSCKKAAELTDKAQFVRLGPIDKIKLRMHLKACALCNAYSKHSLLMDQAIDKLVNPGSALTLELPQEVKLRIIQEIRV